MKEEMLNKLKTIQDMVQLLSGGLEDYADRLDAIMDTELNFIQEATDELSCEIRTDIDTLQEVRQFAVEIAYDLELYKPVMIDRAEIERDAAQAYAAVLQLDEKVEFMWNKLKEKGLLL